MVNDIVNKASDFIRELFLSKLPEGYTYHNFNHIVDVTKTAEYIAGHMDVGTREKEKLLLACWFHDSGIVKNYVDHEMYSIELCSDFLQQFKYSGIDIDDICNAILKTRLPSKPESLIEKILCDADISYTGKDEFIARSQLLRTEWFNVLGKTYTDEEWLRNNIEFVSSVKFYTWFAKEHYDRRRRQTLRELVEKNKNLIY